MKRYDAYGDELCECHICHGTGHVEMTDTVDIPGALEIGTGEYEPCWACSETHWTTRWLAWQGPMTTSE